MEKCAAGKLQVKNRICRIIYLFVKKSASANSHLGALRSPVIRLRKMATESEDIYLGSFLPFLSMYSYSGQKSHNYSTIIS